MEQGIFSVLVQYGNEVRECLNSKLDSYEPLVLVLGTSAVAYAVYWVNIHIPHDGFVRGSKRAFFRVVKKLPFIKSKIDEEVAKAEQSIADNIRKLYTSEDGKYDFITELPSKRLSYDEIVKKAEEYLGLGYKGPEDGLLSGALYHGGEELTKLATKIYEMTSWSNTLHAEIYPGICKMESEVVKMVASLFHGTSETCGTVTFCGTESNVLAVKAYRDWGRAVKGIIHPEIIIPFTGHSSFEKAAGLLKMRIKYAPIDPETYTVDVKAMKKLITKNTVMLVGSAPPYPHGCMDNIEAISELGVKYGIPVHVDACLGGFVIAFMERAGYPLPPFDFQLPGVTSMSADTHKYGCVPKGSSVLLFKNKKFRHYQFFMHTESPGGLYVTSTLAGSRPGALIAVCWSALLHFGMDGYVEMTKKLIETSRYLKYKLNRINGIEVMGNPEMSVVAMKSDQFDIYRLLDEMKSRGWILSPLQFPPSIHFCLSFNQTLPGVADKFLKDMEECVLKLKNDPDAAPTGVAAIYGSSQTIPDRSLIEDITAIYLDKLYEITEKPSRK